MYLYNIAYGYVCKKEKIHRKQINILVYLLSQKDSYNCFQGKKFKNFVYGTSFMRKAPLFTQGRSFRVKNRSRIFQIINILKVNFKNLNIG